MTTMLAALCGPGSVAPFPAGAVQESFARTRYPGLAVARPGQIHVSLSAGCATPRGRATELRRPLC
jgi:hypothetical protein